MTRTPFVGELVTHRRVASQTVYIVVDVPLSAQGRHNGVYVKWYSGDPCPVRPMGLDWFAALQYLTSVTITPEIDYPEGI